MWNQPYFADLLHAFMQQLEGTGRWRIAGDEPTFYLDSLTSEERKEDIALVRGRRVVQPRWQTRETIKLDGKLEHRTDNHWLDCERMQLVVMVTQGWLAAQRVDTAPASLGNLFSGGTQRQRRW